MVKITDTDGYATPYLTSNVGFVNFGEQFHGRVICHDTAVDQLPTSLRIGDAGEVRWCGTKSLTVNDFLA